MPDPAEAAAEALDSGAAEIADDISFDEVGDDPFETGGQDLDDMLGSEDEAEETTTEASTETEETTTEASTQEPETPAEPAPSKVKVDGEEREVTQQELVKSYELAQASYKRFEEAAKLRGDVDNFVDAVTRAADSQDYDLMASIFRQMGADFDGVVEARIDYYINQAKLTPQQREYQKFREEQNRWDRQKQEDQEQAHNSQRQVHQDSYEKQFTNEFQEVLTANNLPVNNYTMGQITALVRSRIEAGVPYTVDMAKDMGSRVKQEYFASFKDLTSGMEGPQLADLVGTEGAGRLRKHQLSQAKDKRLSVAAGAEGEEAPAPQKKTKKTTSLEEFAERLDGL